VFRALVALVPAGMLLSGSLVRLSKGTTVRSLLQFVGAGCLVVVVLTHIFETQRWFSSMGWGLDGTVGHYLDLACAALGVALFPLGYLLDAFQRQV